MRRTLVGAVVLSALACTACDDDQPAATGKAESTASGATPAATASGSAAAPPAPEAAVCEVEEEKVWGKWANRRTGLTLTKLADGRHAVGAAFGTRPAVLVFDSSGNGTLKRIGAKTGSESARSIKSSEGRRDLQRVTPAVQGGKVGAFADYRDKYESGRRRIYCGPAENDESRIVFDGDPILEKHRTAAKKDGDEKDDGEKAEPAKPAAKASAAAPKEPATGAPPSLKIAKPMKLLPPEPATVKNVPTKEIRDCRTFVDGESGRVWGVASELSGTKKGDEIEWHMELFSFEDSGKKRTRIYSVDIGSDPKTLYTFEAPVAEKLNDGRMLLTARYRGALLAWTLNDKLQRTGSSKTYREGWPTLPRMHSDGDATLLLTSHRVGKSGWKATYFRIGKGESLPSSLTDLDVDVEAAAEPTLSHIGDQRWLAIQKGDRRKAQLEVMPVDEKLKPTGKHFLVNADGPPVYESHLIPAGERLVVVFLRLLEGGNAELVSKRMRCSVTK